MNMELLAPAGSAASLSAAIQSGADAVYLGGTEFGARHSAENFTLGEMSRWVDYCHLYGADVHVTVNTLIKEKELHAMQSYVKQLAEIGVDALIVQDLGAADVIKNTVPDMTLHASTQMSVTTLEEVNALEKMGFSRVVLARELNEMEIGHICKNTPLEIEVFVHGAICMCYSGKCLMSSILGGRSGNRGRCAQPCRLPYELTEGHKKVGSGYLLSPRDMALINDLGTLKRIGVKSLKIEGRLKRAEYVSAVVGVYRKYLDMVSGGEERKASEADMRELTDAFSRTGFTNGYLKDKLGAGMMSIKSPSGTGDTKFTAEAEARTAENANIRKIPIRIEGTLKSDMPFDLAMQDNDGNTVKAVGTLKSEAAHDKPLTSDRIGKQLLKLGATPFICENISVSVEEGITIPVKEINEVRREACGKLMKSRIYRSPKTITDYEIPSDKRDRPDRLHISVSVMNDSQLKAARAAGIKNIQKLDPFSGTLNVFNSQTVNYLASNGAVILSPELNLREIEELLENTKAETEIIAYGHLPLMIMKNCPIKAMGKCQKGKNMYKLRDRKKEEFPLVCGSGCRCILLNSKPVYMADKAEDLKRLKINGIRLIFTVENFSQCGKIIDEYKRALSGERVENSMNNFTRGHFYRGVQ